MSLAEELGIVEGDMMTTYEYARKNLEKSKIRLRDAESRKDPSVYHHKEIVWHWTVIFNLLKERMDEQRTS